MSTEDKQSDLAKTYARFHRQCMLMKYMWNELSAPRHGSKATLEEAVQKFAQDIECDYVLNYRDRDRGVEEWSFTKCGDVFYLVFGSFTDGWWALRGAQYPTVTHDQYGNQLDVILSVLLLDGIDAQEYYKRMLKVSNL